MLNLFLRARAHDYFRARSVGRDTETDRSRVAPIAAAIGDALQSAEAEHEGLSRRLLDVGARAAMTTGNAVDEYLTREANDERALVVLETEMVNGDRRLKELASTISHFKFLRTALLSRFPDFKPVVDSSQGKASNQV
jgi:hypothetical protein